MLQLDRAVNFVLRESYLVVKLLKGCFVLYNVSEETVIL